MRRPGCKLCDVGGGMFRTVRPVGNPPGSQPVRRAEPPSLETLSHPLLGPAPTLQLMPDRTDIAGAAPDQCIGDARQVLS